MKLRELFISWQAKKLETWHHTAHFKMCFVKEGTPYHMLHPYLKKSSSHRSVPIPRGKKLFND